VKFLSLHIKRYGQFSDVPFSFKGDGVQLVVGPNEAGKTTILEFVRELLFGFAERNPYDFGNGRIEGTATLQLASGQSVQLHRHKGRKHTVSIKLDGQETDHDADAFNRLLGGATVNLFRSVFAFGIKELADADRSLGHESVRSALYSGGLATVVNPKHLLDSLKNEAEKLFKERAQNPLVNALCSEIGSLTKQVKDKSVRSEAYEQRRDQLKEAQEQARKVTDELNQLRRDHSLTKKLVSAQPISFELNSLRLERGGLTVPEGFPIDGKQQFETLQGEIARLTGEHATLIEDIDQDQQDLRKIEIDPGLIQHKATIEHAQRMIQSVEDARRDLPLRQGEMETIERQVQNDLAELAPNWSRADLQAFQIDAGTQATVEGLVKERQQLHLSETNLITRQETLVENLRNWKADLSTLSQPEDVSVLSGLLDRYADYNRNVDERARLQRDHGKTTPTLAAQLLRLNPPLNRPMTDAYALPVPPEETIAQFKREFAERQQHIHTAQQSLAEEEATLTGLQRELAALRGGSAAVPTRDALAQLRDRRDAGWALIRRKYIAGEDPGAALVAWLASVPSHSLPDVYEEVVRESDRHADALFEKSSAVAKQEQVDEVLHQVETKRAALKTQQDAAATLQQRWHELWQPCGFEPLEPDAMESWLQQQRKLGQLVQQRDQLAIDVQILSEHITGYESLLSTALGYATGVGPALVAAARTRVNDARTNEQERQNLEKTRQRLREQEKTLGDDVQTHRKREQAWQTRWQVLLGKLRLPMDWSTDLTQSVLARLATARVNLTKVPEYERRIASMKQRLDEFDLIVSDLCEAVARELLNKPPEVAATTLQERLTAAMAAQERRATVEENLATKRKKLPNLNRQLATAQNRRSAFLSLAGADSDDEFRQVADRATRILELEKALASKQRELDLVRENEEPGEFTARLQEADLDLLTERLQDLDAKLEVARTSEKTANELVGSCRNVLGQFENGSAEAAGLQEQVAAKRARLAAGVERYVPLIFARHILQKAIERFEHESQPEMLREVTRIFESMTGGRYVRVERPLEDESPLLVYRNDKEVLEPSQLSTGTREQLYLAIRLAYVLHYCNRAEPLPIVMDDVLANFDDDRVRHTFRALADVARRVQVIMFTCHPHLVEVARDVFCELQPVELGRIQSQGK
jgi:uncharacterized protein YhaN